MRRVAAVIGAALMIALAVVVRGVIDGDDGGSGAAQGPDGPLRLVCSTELGPACDQVAAAEGVEVTVQAAGTTEATFTASDWDGAQSPYDAWLTLAPMPELTDLRAGDEVLVDGGDPLASSEVVFVADDDRAAVLLDECGTGGESVSVRCVADAAGAPWGELGGSSGWGRISLGFTDPSTSAAGQEVLGTLATAYFAGEDLAPDEYASNDFGPTGFQSWLGDVADEVDVRSQGGTPLDRLIQRGPAAVGVVATLEATATDAIVGTRAEDDLTVLYPSPMATAVATLAPVDGAAGAADVDSLRGPLQQALADLGWNTDDPTQTGLPRAGVADALGRLWDQVS